MESLITFLLILLISAIGTWLKRLGQKQAEKASEASRRAPPSTQERKPTNWEDELRRLLGEEEPPPPPRPAPPQPPVVARPKLPQVLPPSTIGRAPTLEVTPLPVPSIEHIVAGDLARLQESSRAYERAGNLDKAVAEYLGKISSTPVKPTSVLVRTPPSPEVTQALSLLKNPRAARQAIIAAVILGPPKALEPI